jgi:hypothetical protein
MLRAPVLLVPTSPWISSEPLEGTTIVPPVRFVVTTPRVPVPVRVPKDSVRVTAAMTPLLSTILLPEPKLSVLATNVPPVCTVRELVWPIGLTTLPAPVNLAVAWFSTVSPPAPAPPTANDAPVRLLPVSNTSMDP